MLKDKCLIINIFIYLKLHISKCLVLLMTLFMLIGCSSNSTLHSSYGKTALKDSKSDLLLLAKIDSHYKIWKKTPYRYGGSSLKGTDCSGLVMNFFKTKLAFQLPRTTLAQSKLGYKVTTPQAGDLVFFKTGRGENGLHVGIYYADGKFLHASTSKGVIYSYLNDNYWKKHYWMTRRVSNQL